MPGKGPVVGAGQSVEVNYYGVNGRTGQEIRRVLHPGTAGRLQPGAGRARLQQGLAGQRKVSRVLIAMPGKDGYDPWVVTRRPVSKSATR